MLRRSLRALAATDPVVGSFRIAQREVQLGFMAELLGGPGGGGPGRPRCLLALLGFERVRDAIADGEAEALGVSEAALRRGLEQQLRAIVERR